MKTNIPCGIPLFPFSACKVLLYFFTGVLWRICLIMISFYLRKVIFEDSDGVQGVIFYLFYLLDTFMARICFFIGWSLLYGELFNGDCLHSIDHSKFPSYDFLNIFVFSILSVHHFIDSSNPI